MYKRQVLLRVVIDLVVVFTEMIRGRGHTRSSNVLPPYKPAKRSVSRFVRFETDVYQLLRNISVLFFSCVFRCFFCILFDLIICEVAYSVKYNGVIFH